MKKRTALTLCCALVLPGCRDSSPEASSPATGTSASNVTSDGSTAGGGISDWVAPSQMPGSDGAIVGEVVEGEIQSGDVAGDLDNIGPSLETLLAPVEELFRASRFEEAVVAAREVRKQLPDDPRTLMVIANIANGMGQTGNIQGAIEVLESLPEASTDRNIQMELLHHYQQGSQDTEDKEEAVALIQKATAIVRDIGMNQPWAKLFLFDEASLLSSAGRKEESATVLREAYEAGYEEYVAPAETFAENMAALRVIEAFEPILKEQYSTEIREEIMAHEPFPFGFELTAVDGAPVATDSYKGKIAIVDFWGTWCPPCRMEIPHFIRLSQNYMNDLAIVGLNYNEQGSTEEQEARISEFMQANAMTYPCAIGDQETAQQVPNLTGFPTTLFLDRTGVVRLQLVGYHPYEKLQAAVQYLIDESAAADTAADSDNSTDS